MGPDTGDFADADPTHRWAVCLTDVKTHDYKQRTLIDPVKNRPVTVITWAQDDALPFPLCLSSTSDVAHSSIPLPNVSVARGNVVPADHGVWVTSETLGIVPPPAPHPISNAGCTCTSNATAVAPISRFYPQLMQSPLTFSIPFAGNSSASSFFSTDPSTARPLIAVQSDDGGSWVPEHDLLSSDDTDRVFVAEIEHDNSGFLRFGDGQYGMAPDQNLQFTASYRVGNGSAGNVGRDTLVHAVFPANFLPPLANIISARNPLPAAGGIDAEDMEHIRQYAPFSYQTQLRCVTEADYGQQASSIQGVREARGTLRWTGSWYTAFISIDPVASLTPKLVSDTTRDLNLLRMMGTDLAVEGAILVGLQIEMEICIDPEHFAGDVFTSLMKVFITGNQCSGRTGILNAANFTFGETVYASPLIAAAQQVDGVLSVTLTTFTRMDDPTVDGVAQGFLTLGTLEIPRCDNDPNHLDRGQFVLHLDGGK